MPDSRITRRSLLALVAGAAALPLACRPHAEKPMTQPSTTARLPSLFLAHGAPPLLDDARWVEELHGWAGALPVPRSILMISAHWEARPISIGATTPQPLIYDFYGFPPHYYQQKYAAPGAPELAARVRGLLAPLGPVQDAPQRGLDHGAYVPLVAMYPQADVPVLQLSLPVLDARELFALGRALAPLRDEGVLIIGSGFLTHNLRRVQWSDDAPVPAWAREFDAWCEGVLRRRDVDALMDYRQRAPGVELALPTHEHFAPVSVALGAADSGPVSFPISGFWLGSLTRRSVQLG
jgi:4,5-DOPA dioxygenase extradiol